MAKGSSSSTPADATDPSTDFPVFIDTNLDTHLAMIVTAHDKVADLKRKLMDEHLLCFPDVGEITIHAMKVRRKSCFYHLSDSMLVRSAFLGSKRAWFVHVDASSTCLKSSGPGPTEILLRSENGGQLQKSHLLSLETGASNLLDGQAVRTHSPAVNYPSAEKNLLQPDSNTILVNNCHEPTSCDPLAKVPSVPDDSSLPQDGSIIVDNSQVISSHEDRVVSKNSNPGGKDSAADLVASLDILKGSDPKVPKNLDLVNDRTEVLDAHNPSQDNAMIDQRENYVGDKELRVNNDEDRPVLIDNDKSEKRSRDLQPDNSLRENLQVATKKRRKRKEKDVIVEHNENPSEDVRAGAKGSDSLLQTDVPNNLSSLNASHETHKAIEIIAGMVAESLVGVIDASEINGSKEKTKGDGSALAVSSGDKIVKKSKKHRVAGLKGSDLPLVEEHQKAIADKNAVRNDDHVGILEHVEIGNEDNALPKIRKLGTMTLEATSRKDGVDTLMFPEVIEATEMANFGDRKGKKPKKIRATRNASHSGVEYVNDKGEVASLKPDLHGLDNNHDQNLNSRQHGIEETKEVENASSQTKKKETLITSQADNASGNEACSPKLAPISGTEESVDFRDEKGKRKSKKTRSSNAKSLPEPSMEPQDGAHKTLGDGCNTRSSNVNSLPVASMQLQDGAHKTLGEGCKIRSSNAKSLPEPSMELKDGAHKTLGDGQNLDIHQTDENKKEEKALPRKSGNKKEENALPGKRNKLKSDKTSSKNQLAGSMLEGEDNRIRTRYSQPDKIAASVNGSQGEGNNHDVNFKEFFVPRAGELGDAAKELAAVQKPHERTSKRARRSNVESEHTSHHLQSSLSSQDQHKHKKSPQDGKSDAIELQGPSSTYHHDNRTSVIAGDGMGNQPDHQHENFVDGPNEREAINSKIADDFVNGSSIPTSAVHGSSKVSVNTFDRENNASEAASSASTKGLGETIYISKLGKKLPSLSNQYYVAVNRVPTSDSIFKHVSSSSSEDEGGGNDSDATTVGFTDNSSSSAYSDGEQKRSPPKTRASRKRAHVESPGTGPASPVAHGGKNKENDGNDIALSQSYDMGAKSKSLSMLLRKSSSYKKAKLTASQSILQDTESQPVDVVPDSLAAHDLPEVLLSQ